MMQYDKLLNRTLAALPPSGIRRFFDIANEMEDVISLSVGEPDFATPWHIRQEGIRNLEGGKTWYTPNAGLIALRQEISRFTEKRIGVQYDARTQVLVTVGGSEAIDLAMRALINPGDEVLVPQPSLVCYDPLAQMNLLYHLISNLEFQFLFITIIHQQRFLLYIVSAMI